MLEQISFARFIESWGWCGEWRWWKMWKSLFEVECCSENLCQCVNLWQCIWIFVELKPWILDFGCSTFQAFFISSKFINLQSSAINIESIETDKVTADKILILIYNNTLLSFVWLSIALNIHVFHFGCHDKLVRKKLLKDKLMTRQTTEETNSWHDKLLKLLKYKCKWSNSNLNIFYSDYTITNVSVTLQDYITHKCIHKLHLYY